MLALRPIIVNTDLIVLGGNMRMAAASAAGLKEVPVMYANGLTEQQQREFIIKDNVGFGEWDWDMLANEWDATDLADWGLEVPVMADPADEEPDGPEDMKAWFLNIQMDTEEQTQALYEELVGRGFYCKIVN